MPDEIDLPSGPPTGEQRRWRRPLLTAVTVSAVAILAAVLGLAVGRATAPGPTIVVAPGPVVEESPVASSFPIVQPQPSTIARPDLLAPVTDALALPAVFIAASGLSDDDTLASGYALTRGSVDATSLAAALAGTFGLSGDVNETGTGWIVGQPGGTVAAVTVNDDPLLSWSYTDPIAAAESEDGVSMKPETAKDLATEVLGRIGVDTASVDWQIDRYAELTEVTAWQLINGDRTQLAWRVGFGKDRAIVSARGFAAGLIEVPGYPVVGAATAVRRAALPTWAAVGPKPIPSTEEPQNASPTPTPQETAVPGRPALQVPMHSVVVEGAELGLGQFWQPDGGLLILPAYLLTGDDGSRWSLIGITSDDVDFVKSSSSG